MHQLSLVTKKKNNLTTVFWTLAIALSIYELTSISESFWLNLICMLVTAIALLPAYLWCTGKALGMPIFPIFAMTFIWTYALPLISGNSNVLVYSVDQRLFAGYTTLSFLAVGCAVWFRFVKKAPIPPPSFRSLAGTKGNRIFFLSLAISVFFNVASVGGWLAMLALNGGALSLIRNTVIAFTALSSFVLAYRLGKGDLTNSQARTLILLLASFMLSSTLSFLLISSATIFLSTVAAFVIGRRQVPTALILTMVLCFAFLHAGKAEMRGRYWAAYGQSYIQPWQYPTVYGEWFKASTHELDLDNSNDDFASARGQSFSDRASVIQMMMMSQSLSPQAVPYLNGYTYQILPEMIVPRLFYPQKPWSHEGTFRLNIHYGRQTREQAQKTTISWGLLAESYANFGYWGCIGLGIILGTAYGFVGRLSINAPILSLQSLVSVFLMTYAIQSEWTAGVYVAALSQHAVALGAMAIFLMKIQPNEQFVLFNNDDASPLLFEIRKR